MLQQTGAKTYWAVAEKNGLGDPLWQNFDRIWTGEGGLGERQDQVYATLREYHHNVILMGADCPQLTAETIKGGFDTLKTHDYCIGPAEDGGYYLLAGRKAIPRNVWTGVEYSASKTCEDLCAELDGSLHRLPRYSDVDEEEDLHKMLQQMPDDPSPAQQNLIDWAKDLFSDTASAAAQNAKF